MGWTGLQNGALLSNASKKFEVFLTVDGNLSKQQPLAAYAIAVVVLRAPSNDITMLAKLVPSLLEGLIAVQPGKLSVFELRPEVDFLLRTGSPRAHRPARLFS
jgi:hypothetical protein